MHRNNLFTDRSFWKQTVSLALPVALQSLLTSSFQLVDTMMVSKLGDVTLSAVGMAAQWGWLASLLAVGITSGMSVFIAQYWGVKDYKGIRKVLGMGTITCLLMSGLFFLTALLVPTFVLGLFNKDPNVVSIGCRYLSIVCFSYPAIALTIDFSTLLRNTEHVKLPMYASLVTTVVNIFVDYGLIFGKFGFPKLGVEGAALATVISSWLGPILIYVFSVFQKNLLVGPLKELFGFSKEEVKAFFARAVPVISNEGLWALGTVIMNMIYSNIGYAYYAGMTIFKTFADLAFAFYLGVGSACVVMVGKNVGRGDIRQALNDSARFTVLAPLLGVIVGGTFILLRFPLISLFATGSNLSDITLQTALAVTVFCSAEVGFRNIPYIQIVGVFRSGGDTLHGMLFDLGCQWVFAIPAALIAANVLHLPFIGVVMVAYLGEDIPKSILCLKHYFSRKWIMPVTPEGQAGLEELKKQQ